MNFSSAGFLWSSGSLASCTLSACCCAGVTPIEARLTAPGEGEGVCPTVGGLGESVVVGVVTCDVDADEEV